MFRPPLSRVVVVSSPLLILALSALIGLMVHYRTPQRVVTPQGSAPSPADLMSVMQSKVQIERSSIGDKEYTKATRSTATANKLPASTPASKAKMKTAEVSLMFSSTVLKATSFRRELQTAMMQISHNLGMKTTSAAPYLIGILFLLLLFLLCALSKPLSRNSARNNASNAQSQKDAAVLEQRDRMLSYTSPMLGAPRFPSSPVSQHVLQASSSNSLLPAPRDIPNQPIRESIGIKPPPLCPTLIMPSSEALLGISMYELAQLSGEGELNIVGASGRPLLRARAKKSGDFRTLEIAMPEANSMPRATVSPPAMNLVSRTNFGSQAGSRTLEIKGMRGDVYGILEMRSSGACYVMKDGQAVLTIDGDAECLQLSIKSSVGLQLASVRCSTELFNGVDYVEIRVEPGVDTILVLSVVLAVLLLSPYLSPGQA